MEATDYQQQAQAFLEQFGLSFSAEYIGADCPPWNECGTAPADPRYPNAPRSLFRKSNQLPCGGIHGGHYQVTLLRAAQSHGRSDKLAFDFWNSYADEYGPGDDAAADAGRIRNRNAMIFEGRYKKPLPDRRCKVTGFSEGSPSSGWGLNRGVIIAKPPTAYDVLAGLAADAQCSADFAEFCSESGYDEDSRRAEATHRRCIAHALKLQQFFSTAELESLAEIQ